MQITSLKKTVLEGKTCRAIHTIADAVTTAATRAHARKNMPLRKPGFYLPVWVNCTRYDAQVLGTRTH